MCVRESVCVCEREKERVCVCVCEREKESVCVCERERERARSGREARSPSGAGSPAVVGNLGLVERDNCLVTLLSGSTSEA